MYEIRAKKINAYDLDVQAYEEQGIQEDMIVFYGDSAFTRWKEKAGNPSMEEVLRAKDGSQAVVNHGIGGSCTEQLLYYYPRLVKAWKPRALVVNVFSNDRDIAYTPEESMALLARLLEWARIDMPGIKLYVCDVRPLLLDKDVKKTWYYQQLEYNELLKQYCQKHDDVTLISHIQSPLFFNNPEDVGDYTKIRDDIYIEDKVHWNQEGYELYATFFKEALKDIL